jgi:hypothetical protein
MWGSISDLICTGPAIAARVVRKKARIARRSWQFISRKVGFHRGDAKTRRFAKKTDFETRTESFVLVFDRVFLCGSPRLRAFASLR